MNVSKANDCKFLYYCGDKVTYDDLVKCAHAIFWESGLWTSNHTLR